MLIAINFGENVGDPSVESPHWRARGFKHLRAAPLREYERPEVGLLTLAATSSRARKVIRTCAYSHPDVRSEKTRSTAGAAPPPYIERCAGDGMRVGSAVL